MPSPLRKKMNPASGLADNFQKEYKISLAQAIAGSSNQGTLYLGSSALVVFLAMQKMNRACIWIANSIFLYTQL
ncbi:hypothetical protein DHC50_11815 [Arenibacter sp. A80]|nr:hypothetical protein [Arenibacter sp. A80]RFT56068.1 hypothetical protein D0S24_11815 [Arenibacter sp. P308M17]